MEYQKQIQIRRQKGQEIARSGSVKLQGNKWLVPSQSSGKTYEVVLGLGNSKCSCPDNTERQMKCKHIFAVEITVSKTIDSKGNITITETKKVYVQDWHNYTLAQNQEGKLFRELLKDLVENVEEPIRTGAGRPSVPLKEALFCAIEKVYSMQSSRRAYSLYLEDAKKQQITKAPNYNVINILLNDAEVRPILYRLLQITAMPLKSVETQFAIDSTGFRTTQFSQYCKEKHNTKREHSWVKAHLCTGVKTNIVTDVEITDENGADSPQFIPLTEGTRNLGFNMQEISADKAYSARDNLDVVAENGGIAYIPFKTNATQHSHGGRV
jgi:transposase